MCTPADLPDLWRSLAAKQRRLGTEAQAPTPEFCAAWLRELLGATHGELLNLRGRGGSTWGRSNRRSGARATYPTGGRMRRAPATEVVAGAQLWKRPLQDSNLGPSD